MSQGTGTPCYGEREAAGGVWSRMTVVNGSIQMSRDEIVEAIEKGALDRRGVSATDLLRAYRSGELQEPGEVADLLALGDLLSDDDPVLTAG